MTGHATPEAGMSAGHWSLLFGVRRSVRYHVRREQYFGRAHHLGAFVAALTGSATIAALLADHAALATAAASTSRRASPRCCERWMRCAMTSW